MSPYRPIEHSQEVPNSDTVVENFDWDEREAAALAVVKTVASVTGKETTELEPLSLTIDTDALNTLFVSFDDLDRSTGYIQFTYEGCLVEILADDKLAVTKLENSEKHDYNRGISDGDTTERDAM